MDSLFQFSWSSHGNHYVLVYTWILVGCSGNKLTRIFRRSWTNGSSTNPDPLKMERQHTKWIWSRNSKPEVKLNLRQADLVLLGIVLSFVAFLLLRFLLNLVTFVLFSLCAISVRLLVCVFECVNVCVRDWGANLCALSIFKDQVS